MCSDGLLNCVGEETMIECVLGGDLVASYGGLGVLLKLFASVCRLRLSMYPCELSDYVH